MGEAQRAVYKDMQFTMEYQKDGDNWTCIVYMPTGHSRSFQFEIGKEFDSQTLDGRPIKVLQLLYVSIYVCTRCFTL